MLSASDLSACDAALNALSAAADQADQLVAGAAFWTPSSALAGMQADATATRNLYDTLSAKFEGWATGVTDATHDDAVSLIQAADAGANITQLQQAAQTNDTANAVATVTAQTATQVATAAKWTGVALVPIALGALALLMLVYLPRGRS